VLSEVCIALAIQCLRASYLYFYVLVILQDHTNRVYGVAVEGVRRGLGPQRFDRKFNSEDDEERSRRGHTETHLCRGKDLGLSMELPNQELGPRG
jgi:hypothetical protein